MAITRPIPTFRAKMIGGKIVYADQAYYEAYANGLNGKEVRITIERLHEPINPNLMALYFGVIIRGACMQSEVFSTYRDEKEVHDIIAKELRSFIVPRKDGKTESIVDNVLNYDNSDFAKYINDVILYLESEYGIFVKHYEDYKLDRVRKTRKVR